jgi:hypothetical protein
MALAGPRRQAIDPIPLIIISDYDIMTGESEVAMIVLVVLGVALVLALGTFATAALYLGLFGAFGAIRLVRCNRCNHWGWTSGAQPLRSCPICRHGRLLHPLVSLHWVHGRRHRAPEGRQVSLAHDDATQHDGMGER